MNRLLRRHKINPRSKQLDRFIKENHFDLLECDYFPVDILDKIESYIILFYTCDQKDTKYFLNKIKNICLETMANNQ